MNRFCTKYIWFSSLLGDLVFLAIVNTLFFTIVKGLSASQITLLTTIPAGIGIVIQPSLLKIIHKIGNTASVRLGAFCLLISSILLTFGSRFVSLVLGYVFYEIAFVLKNMEGIMLKNNLIAFRKAGRICRHTKSIFDLLCGDYGFDCFWSRIFIQYQLLFANDFEYWALSALFFAFFNDEGYFEI